MLNRALRTITDRLGIRFTLLPPTEGILVGKEPEALGLVRCDPCGAYAHPSGDLTVVFKPLRDAAGGPVSDCGGLRQPSGVIHPDSKSPRFANVDVSFVLSGVQAEPEVRLYNVMLHALLSALAREPTKLWNTWGGTFLVPDSNCDLEYRYPSHYGKTPEERARATAEGWKHYNEAILNGTAVRYVPCLDGP